MAIRETVQHDPVYAFLHAKIFGKSEEKPALEIYLPPHLKASPALVRSIMLPVWQAEVETVWSAIVTEMAAAGVQGDFLEFGVFSGGSFRKLLDLFSGKGVINKFWGFDSFEGLPAPVPERDQATWSRGQFKVTRDQAWANITKGLASTNHIELVEGWFAETLPGCAATITNVAFVRIDCDLWSSTVDALTFLEGRLVDGAVLYFDDWTFDAGTGETRAFFEFAERTGHLYRFEKLYVVSQNAFSMRVRLLKEHSERMSGP